MTRTSEGRFAPGHSGNPNGRPKTPAHIKAMLDGLTEKAVLALGEALDGDDPKLKLTAAQEVLNRALGKPHTSASIDVTQNNLPAAHLAALTQLALAHRSMAGASPITIEAESLRVEPDAVPRVTNDRNTEDK
ncbi:hypothetical protein GOC87_18805 [Sinorhizobium meliloti]|uniref:DUF5681 domain-containing protein n=1 Tax=Rhizobium meliloti TaxID=382 RepID=UPI000B498654|nr:DUF5681 domain-containing protein [Sinorhizobium meliloti]ASP96717.1 hypothetical protein CDO24_04265 [Sinorhizobium meliloti]MDW9705635.1 hypothetical protein [Sinorhizobium meliloti]MDW9935373.1 hypothetical protein [Sinorhizobium meliloti]MDX0101729.1 hypothetical protein [Sinorhizobium meliloti]MDX0120516.1 hypothetical protein [Sinorhizobium meliloti]